MRTAAAWAAWAVWTSKSAHRASGGAKASAQRANRALQQASVTTKPGLLPGFVLSGVRRGKRPVLSAAMSDTKTGKGRYEPAGAGASLSSHSLHRSVSCRASPRPCRSCRMPWRTQRRRQRICPRLAMRLTVPSARCCIRWCRRITRTSSHVLRRKTARCRSMSARSSRTTCVAACSSTASCAWSASTVVPRGWWRIPARSAGCARAAARGAWPSRRGIWWTRCSARGRCGNGC
uniref:Uncharacterized protein n=1 Tax=Pseudomonas aeruginosa TaxID=287 RepID=A0A894X7D5_PSEAI|nr:hypothetical protein [Pseudomonas aeruginosa]